jgi:hypothetical protein
MTSGHADELTVDSSAQAGTSDGAFGRKLALGGDDFGGPNWGWQRLAESEVNRVGPIGRPSECRQTVEEREQATARLIEAGGDDGNMQTARHLAQNAVKRHRETVARAKGLQEHADDLASGHGLAGSA